MEWIIVLVVFAAVVLLVLTPSKNKSYSYQQRGTLFTAAERSFLGVLEQAVPEQYRVLGKVRVADVLSPAKGMNRKRWQIAFNKISSKHFDYVLCEKDTLAIAAVIELDDKSHATKKAKARDALLESACESASLKLIRFPVKSTYQVKLVIEEIERVLSPAVTEGIPGQ